MASEAGGESVRGIGARLRTAREKSGLTVLQAAERLHVDARVLEALEAEDFAILGADVYVRGHLRRYAEAVGESAAQLQELYSNTSAPATPDLTRIPRAGPASRASPLLLPALLLVVGVALIGAFWWFLNLPRDTGQPLEGTAPAAPAAGETDEQSSRHRDTTSSAGVRAPAGSLPSTSAGQAELGVRFSALSWVEISDAEGRRLLEGLYARGSVREVRGTAPLRVVLGNAPAVDLELNGQPVPFTGLVHRNGSAYLSIDNSGHVSAAAPRLAHGD
jgi:cytoskeleton protein RodZ